MLAIAALVPETALLVPGAAGRAAVLPEVRLAALDAVAELVATRCDRVVVVAPGPADRRIEAPHRPSLAAAGIDDAALGWSRPDGAGPLASGDVPATGASVALLLLARAGWTGSITVLEVAPEAAEPGRPDALRALGAELVAGPGRTALLVAGSLSARHGSRAPAAQDDRAASFDAATLADLSLGDPLARHRLGAIPAELAAELVVTAWAPLQVLVGAAGAAGAAGGDVPYDASVRHASAPLGVAYAVVVWRGVQP